MPKKSKTQPPKKPTAAEVRKGGPLVVQPLGTEETPREIRPLGTEKTPREIQPLGK